MGRIVRRVRQAGVYFVTTDTWERRKLFLKTSLAQAVITQLLACRERGFYRLHAFVLIPDHMHLLITPGASASIEKAMQMIKGGSAHRIGSEGRLKFPVWHAGFHDRWIRNATEYVESKRYIEHNPVEAKLTAKPEDYAMSSASGQYQLDVSRFEAPVAKAT